MANKLDELCAFLTTQTPPELKIAALEYILGLSAGEDGCQFLVKNNNCMKFLIDLIDVNGDKSSCIAHKCLVNFSTEDKRAEHLLTTFPSFIQNLLSCIINVKNPYVDLACQLASNITRSVSCCKLFLSSLNVESIKQLIDLFCQIHNNEKITYHHLASMFCNLTQLPEGRRLIFDREHSFVQRFFPFTTFMSSEIRRLGIAGMLRNCCFDAEYHEWLLSEEVNILIPILLPLVGPDEFQEDDMELLPLELQYLGEDKVREPNPIIRKMLIEAITQLCATKNGRSVIRKKQAYLILRELHKWETSRPVIVACENLVDILIGDEPESGMENLKEVEIPVHLSEQFEKIDKELLQ